MKLNIQADQLPKFYQDALTFFEKQPQLLAYIYGGYLRNLLLGRSQDSTDIDLVIFGVDRVHLKEILMPLLQEYGYVFEIAKENAPDSFCYLKYKDDAGKSYKIDIRCELELDVVFDARHLDFTCNALYYRIAKKELKDPTGKAQEAIAKKNIRSCFSSGFKTRERNASAASNWSCKNVIA